MPSRISDAASNSSLIQYMLNTQKRMLKADYQVSSGYKSPDYAGISQSSGRLITLENERDLTNRYIDSNTLLTTNFSVESTALTGLEDTMKTFRDRLQTFKTTDDYSEQAVADIQKLAFQSLQQIESYLNTSVGGEYIFSGAKTDTQPVDLKLSTLASFQDKYDGTTTTYPTTRDAHLSDLSASSDTNSTHQLFIDSSNWLTFHQDDDGDTGTSGMSSIEATSAMFSSYEAGSRITVSGTGSNDGDYTVDHVSSDGTKVYIKTEMLTDETVPTAFTTETGSAAVTFALNDGSTLDNTDTGNIDFSAPNTLTATTASSLSGISVGDTITVSGSGSNDGTYTVTANDGTTLTVSQNDGATFTLADGTALDNADTGSVAFDRSANTITAATSGAFSNAQVGQVITVDGTTANDGTYTISAVSSDGKTVTVESTKLTDEGTSSGTSTFFDYTAGSQLVFDTSTQPSDGGTITAQNVSGTALAGVFSSLKVGDTITVADSPTNDGDYTIKSISSDGSSVTLDPVTSLVTTETDDTGVTVSADDATKTDRDFSYTAGVQLQFTAANDTIQVQDIATSTAVANAFAGLRVGQTIVVAGTAGSDATYTISSISSDKSTITVSQDIAADETYDPSNTSGTGTAATMKVYATDGTISTSGSYYQGDTTTVQHRIDEDRTLDLDITAADPAFEKAIRAMSLIAQGQFGTEGGLDQNQSRVDDALYLIKDSIDSPQPGAAPYGDEELGDIHLLQYNHGFNMSTLSDIIDTQKTKANYLDKESATLETADPLDAITQLLNEQKSLEASYQAMSRVFQMNLADYL